ncbi:MAG: NAD-dependent epimerase/dehydratase family protein [bacterium]|nr:NAD-dependent epimerase/dehydratase family protein [bacterium]
MPTERVFLTGASGFVGGHVLRELLAAGYRVRALARESGREIAGCEMAIGDLRNSGDLVRALQGCRYLVHCAALYSFAPRDRQMMHRVNVEGTAGLLEAARIAGVERAVVTSSSATVGEARAERLATEEDWAATSGHSAYHQSKVDAERAALAAQLPVVLVLPTTPVGPGDRRPTPTGRLVLDFARGRIPAAPPPGGLNLVAVEDVARAHVAALERGRPRERYLIGGTNLGLDDLWRMLAEVTGLPAPRWRIPYALAWAAGWLDELRCRYLQREAEPFVPLEGVRMSRCRMHVDCGKAAVELGYDATPVRGALERAVTWYRTHGYTN